MTQVQFESALRAYCRRRPFVRFIIEFASGGTLLVRHPELVKKHGKKHGTLYAMRMPNGGSVVFPSESVTRMLDESARE
jgi:hypothetical protein